MEEFSNRIDAQRHILQIVNMAMQNKEQRAVTRVI